MIRFEATVELMLCMIGSLMVGFLIGWLSTSFLIGLAVAIGFFCFTVDMIFSYEAELEDEDDDDF